MTVTSLSSLTGTTAATSTTSSSTTQQLFDNYETFLTLLTTQIQNQDPLDPMDTSEFTNQLVQYASVEQQIETNDVLSEIRDLTSWSVNTLALSYVGKTVEIDSDYAPLQDGQATWSYNLDDTADSVTLRVVDQNGDVVYEADGELDAGSHTFSWDGMDADGNQLADGPYRLEVVATDDDGNAVSAGVTSFGKVTKVSTEDGDITLQIGDISLEIDDVIAIQSDS
ncbi:MAG TPA: flagellar hook capping FlgD N-terminal domain-containing protein [Dongiaceae bacterium]|jgi:flagellar basal-body rod modification protein FlgD|nr:flagellar hook capping FlgD N-terminal domain-containing protein [Dongiaceae bacterium]